MLILKGRFYQIILPMPVKLWEVLIGAVLLAIPLMCNKMSVLLRILEDVAVQMCLCGLSYR